MHAALGEIEAHLVLPGGLESLHREGLDAHAGEYTEHTQMREELLPRFVDLPAGEFIMGSPDGDDDERPVRRVSARGVLAVGASGDQRAVRRVRAQHRPPRARRARLAVVRGAVGRGRLPRAGLALHLARRRPAARSRPASGHAGHARRRRRLLRVARHAARPQRAAAQRGRVGARRSRRDRRPALSVGRRDRSRRDPTSCPTSG